MTDTLLTTQELSRLLRDGTVSTIADYTGIPKYTLYALRNDPDHDVLLSIIEKLSAYFLDKRPTGFITLEQSEEYT